MKSSQKGFTLIELTVVLGLLSGFLVFLTQMLAGGVELFDEGETGQELADLANSAAQSVREAVADMVGPQFDTYESTGPDARLLAQWVPLGLIQPSAQGARVQVIRSTVRVDEAAETALLRDKFRQEADESAGSREEQDIADRLESLVAQASRSRRADMVLIPWPADRDGVFLELRRGLLLPGQLIPIDRRREVSLMGVESVAELGAEVVHELSKPIATSLLHVEFEFWGQDTKIATAPPDRGGPQRVWDSSRAGLLFAEDDPMATFSLDVGPESLADPTDDVYPRSVRITLVVAREGREARLAAELTSTAKRLEVITMDPLPGVEDEQFIKVGAEWIRFGGVVGNELTGLQRGARNTPAATHPMGTRLRLGKTVRLQVALPHGRDSWR